MDKRTLSIFSRSHWSSEIEPSSIAVVQKNAGQYVAVGMNKGKPQEIRWKEDLESTMVEGEDWGGIKQPGWSRLYDA